MSEDDPGAVATDATVVESVVIADIDEKRAPSMPEIARASAQYFAIPVGRLRGRERVANIVYARHVAMFLCRIDARRSYPEIGRFFGLDHTTVLSADRKIFAKRAEGDHQLERDLKSIRAILALVLVSPPGHYLPAQACRECQTLREANARMRVELLELRQELAALRVRFGCD